MRLPVSVVIPTRDRGWCLSRALRSVLAQSRPPAEVIVIDDGSLDGTRRLVHAGFPEVRYFYQPASGVSRARNHGIERARQPWIALLDSDDAWLPHKLARQWWALQRTPRLLVHTDEIWIRDGRPLNQPRHLRRARTGGWVFENCLERCAISPSSALFPKSLWREVGGFDERLPACEDYDFWLRITCRHPVLYVAEPLLVKYGGHGDQLSRRIPALDRYRIQALLKLLGRKEIRGAARRAVSAVLLEKAGLYAQGALKRGKIREASQYWKLCRTTVLQLRSSSPSKPRPGP